MSSEKADFIRKAQGMMVKGQWYKALDQLEQAYAIDKSDPVITLRMGDIYVKLKDDDFAAQYYIKTADIFAKLGETPKALATYRIALRTDPSLTGVQDKINELASTKRTTQGADDKGAGLDISGPMPDIPAVDYAGPGITPLKDTSPVYEIPPPEDGPLSAINLSDSGNRSAYDSPADVLFGDNMEFSDCSLEAPDPQNTDLLSELSAEELLELMGRMNLRSFGEGETIVREGEEGHSLYIIRFGKVKVVTRNKDEEVVLAMLGGDDFFGEGSFLTGRPRTATIIAEEPTELMELNRDDLNSVMARHPNIEGVLRLFHKTRVSDTLSSLKSVARDFL